MEKIKRLAGTALLAVACLVSIRVSIAGEIELCNFDDIGVGDVCKVKRVEDLHPTQFSVGKAAAQCKAINKIRLKFDRGNLQQYLEAEKRHIPVVLGPGGGKGKPWLYITDRHHLSSAYLLAKDRVKEKKQKKFNKNKLVIQVIYDWRFLNKDKFWQIMEKMQLAWSFDEYGNKKELSTEHPPAYIRDLKDDPFRTVSRWARTGVGYVKANNAVYFLEFKWANFLREQCARKENTDVCNELVPCATFGLQENAEHCKAALEEVMGWVAGSSAQTFMKEKGGCTDSDITTKCGFTGVKVKRVELDNISNELFCDQDPSQAR